MDVASILRAANRAVDEAEVPTELKPIAFEKAVDLLSGKLVPVEKPTGTASPHTNGNGAAIGGTPSDMVGRIAHRLKLDEEIVREVFHEADGVLKVVVQRSKLTKSKWSGSKDVALLVVASRLAAGLEEQVSQDVIREVAEYYGKYDSNFSKALNEMEGDFYFEGTPRKRLFRMRAAGWEHATELVKRLGERGET